MRNKNNIKTVLGYFQNTADNSLTFDEEAIIDAYHKDGDNQSLQIKILSVFGGILASLAFLGFLFIAGLYNSDIGPLVFGGFFIAGSVWMNKKYDKIIIDTVGVSFFIIGFILIGFGCSQLDINENIISITFIIIALGSLSIVQNYILSFVSVLIINGSILTLILTNKAYDIIHIYVSLLALSMTYFFLKEAKVITTNKALSRLYNPFKVGFIFSFLSGLIFLCKKGILPISPDYIWVSSIIITSVIIYLVSKLFDILSIIDIRRKTGIYIFTLLTLVPTTLSPAISGAILIILLCFFVNYKTGLVLGVISFIYFISQYYYDLTFTLLTKSILLFSTGVFFLALYLFTYKKLTVNEKV